MSYQHSVHLCQVCCAFGTEEPAVNTTDAPVNSDRIFGSRCACVTPWLCDDDGFIISDGNGLLDLRHDTSMEACVPPNVCCKRPVNNEAPPPPVTTERPRVETARPPDIIDNQKCEGIRNTRGISVSFQDIVSNCRMYASLFT